MHALENFESVVGVMRRVEMVRDKGKYFPIEEGPSKNLEERPSYQPPKKIWVYPRKREIDKKE